MHTRSHIRLVLAVLFFAPGCDGPDAVRDTTNLIMISLDTCRADRLSCYGCPRENTPNLDRLAEESVLFRDCLAQSCVTAPSHMSIFTGQYVHRHGLTANGEARFPTHTLASVLQAAGWRTAAFTGHGSLQEKYGHGVGFETFQSWSGPEAWPHTRDVSQVVPEALAWVDEVSAGPFFLFLHGYDPHCPYWPARRWRKRYTSWYEGQLDPRNLCGPDVFLDLFEQGAIADPEQRYIADLYDAEIAAADAAIGSLLDALRERDLLDRSILVFLSDHGEALGNEQRIGHGSLLEEILRVPLLIRFPRGELAGETSVPAQLIDVLPTVLSALDVEAPAGIQGTDLFSVLRGSDKLPAEHMRIAQAKHAFSVQFGEAWKIMFKMEDLALSKPRIFDLRADPLGFDDLYAEPEARARFDELADRFRSWRLETRAADARFMAGQGSGELQEEDLRILEALGYAGTDEEED